LLIVWQTQMMKVTNFNDRLMNRLKKRYINMEICYRFLYLVSSVVHHIDKLKFCDVIRRVRTCSVSGRLLSNFLKGPILVPIHCLLTFLIIITFLHILSFIDFLANLDPEKRSRAINEQEEEEEEVLISLESGVRFKNVYVYIRNLQQPKYR